MHYFVDLYAITQPFVLLPHPSNPNSPPSVQTVGVIFILRQFYLAFLFVIRQCCLSVFFVVHQCGLRFAVMIALYRSCFIEQHKRVCTDYNRLVTWCLIGMVLFDEVVRVSAQTSQAPDG